MDDVETSPLSVAATATLLTSCRRNHDEKRPRAHRHEQLLPSATNSNNSSSSGSMATPWFPGLLAACLSYLDGVALLQCELVATEWHTAVQDPALWAQQYCAMWRRAVPLPAALLARARSQLKRVCRERSAVPLELSTRAMWWVHNDQTLRVHNVSLQREFRRGCVESVRAGHALRPLGLAHDRSVVYFEATVVGCGSVGVLRLDEPNVGHFYGAGSSAHVGWLPGSYGFHGDDGKIYWHDGAAPVGGYAVRYAPSWGDTRVLQSAIASPDQRATTIGCGVDATIGQLFFTRNGAFLGHAPMRIESSRTGYGAAVSLHHLGDTVELNLGRAAFVFDIEAYLDEREAVVWRNECVADAA